MDGKFPAGKPVDEEANNEPLIMEPNNKTKGFRVRHGMTLV
ncbi:hypothetical protein [Paenibacillus periandrae]|nr:hypothetical protein [Paenibacillus periandrae]